MIVQRTLYYINDCTEDIVLHVLYRGHCTTCDCTDDIVLRVIQIVQLQVIFTLLRVVGRVSGRPLQVQIKFCYLTL